MAKVNFDVSLRVVEKGRRAPEYELQSKRSEEATLEMLANDLKTTLVLVANTVLREEQAQGFPLDPLVLVDSKKNKRVEDVNPFGKIEFFDRSVNFRELFIATYKQLLERSPVDTGQYEKSHIVFLGNTVVAKSLADLNSWLDTEPEITSTSTVTFVNTRPYARRLESLGVSKSSQGSRVKRERKGKSRDKLQRNGPVVSMPNGTYFLTYRSILRDNRFKKIVRTSFDFISGAKSSEFSGNFTSFKNLRGSREKKAKIGRQYLYPAIIFRFPEANLSGGPSV